MRRRLTIAIIALVVATVALTSIGGYVLIRRATVTTAEQELAGEARAISATFSDRAGLTRESFAKELAVVTSAGDFTSVQFVLLTPDGTVTGVLEGGVGAGRLDTTALLEGHQVTGHTTSLLVYSAVPTPLDARTDGIPVLIVTRQIHSLANGLRYFVLVGLAGTAAAALVAAALARRFTRPLVAAADATGRVASGDLDATVDLGPHVDPEFTRLADSINAMGVNLVRARDQERQFLMSISHELRTPLTSIRGYADAVIDGATDDPVAAARVIAAESVRLERLVQDLLDLARLDADRFSFDFRVVDAADVVRQVVGGFGPRASELGLALDLAPGSETPCPVMADRDRLGQIVANLVENASSFAHSRIVVGVAGDRGRAVVWVDDDGPGIPADRLTRVFDRHVTSDRSEGRGRGSGLGLAIVSELASAMGAVVHAESPLAADGGTRMVVELRPAGGGPDAPVPAV
ncbi:MAG: HAMP domain-containing sensor histidine kinase [Acidimicrobiales bacterium]